MARDWLTDEQVEMEIEELRNDPAVKLALAEQRHKYKRRQYLYQLRLHKKRGDQLLAQGAAIDDFGDEDE